METTPTNDTGTPVRMTNDVTGGDPNNSVDRADARLAYKPVELPSGVRELGTTINMWAYYLKIFGTAARKDIRALEDRGAALEGKATTTEKQTHLDPPPDPPYAPAPT